MWAHKQKRHENITPEIALNYLKTGNKRFLNNLKNNKNLLEQVNKTSEGQFPYAAILSCIDSRTSPELIFDQGLGDIFSIRIAGNILNDDILGSMEFACKISHSELIVVLGHTKCSAIVSACDDFELGNFSGLLKKLQPAIREEKETISERNGQNISFVDSVSVHNVKLIIRKIRLQSKVLSEMETDKEIDIVGAMYNIETGEVTFFDE